MSKEIVDRGNDFVVEKLDRKYGGKRVQSLKVDGASGDISLSGGVVTITGAVNVTGDVNVTGAINQNDTLVVVQPVAPVTNKFVTAIEADGTVDQAQPSFANLSGTVEKGQLPVSLFKMFCLQGADAGSGASHITATGVKVGDKVLGVANITDHTMSTDFEATVTVNDQIQQATTNLSAKTIVVFVVVQS